MFYEILTNKHFCSKFVFVNANFCVQLQITDFRQDLRSTCVSTLTEDLANGYMLCHKTHIYTYMIE